VVIEFHAQAQQACRDARQFISILRTADGVISGDLGGGVCVGERYRRGETADGVGVVDLHFYAVNPRFAVGKATGFGAVAAGRAHGAVFGVIGKVAVETDHFGEEAVLLVANTGFVVVTDFRLLLLGGATTQWGEAPVRTGEQLPLIVQGRGQ